MVFSGFDDGGWRLVVLGCWGVGGNQGWPKNSPENTTQLKGGAGRVGERKEREKMCFGLSCVSN